MPDDKIPSVELRMELGLKIKRMQARMESKIIEISEPVRRIH